MLLKLTHILQRRSHRFVRRSKIALIKCANYSVQHATVMEQEDVLLVVRIHQLSAAAQGMSSSSRSVKTKQIPKLSEIADRCTCLRFVICVYYGSMNSSCPARECTWKWSAPAAGFFHVYEARKIRRGAGC